MTGNTRKILVLFPGALGDFVCFLPALEKIARDCEVDLLARSDYAGILSERIHVESLERREISRLFSEEAESDAALRIFFSVYGRIYSWMGSRERTFLRSLRSVSQGELRCFSFQPETPMHAVDYYLSCVGGVFAPQESRALLRPCSRAVVWARKYAGEHGLEEKKVLIVGPGSGAKEKNWPAAAYRKISAAWERQSDGVAITVLGPAEEENAEISREFETEGHVLRGLNIGQVAALLCQSHGYVGNDSGLTHLAAAMGLPTVAVFGPTDPTRWAPRGARVILLSRQIECSPCDYAAMKNCPHRRCLTSLSTEEVALALSEHFGPARQAHAP
ncbi:MAG: glycosyltransferase family 9 protein [Candidatus Binatia bacterium]